MINMHSAMLLSHIEAWVVELERAVAAFEAAVEEVEKAMDKVEQEGEWSDMGRKRLAHNLRQLADALERTNEVAELVHAANTALGAAMAAAQEIVSNEHLDSPAQTAGETEKLDAAGESSPLVHRILKASLIPAQSANVKQSLGPLPHGSLILEGRYRIVQLLHQRPRVHLYLAHRLTQPGSSLDLDEAPQPLVAIRELVLTGLSLDIQKHIERAAFEEFVSPIVFGSPRLPGVGDRVSIENERHYLVMQLRPTRGERQAVAVTLAELLMARQHWPGWLEIETALQWGMQLCRIVARLHRLGVVLGDLDPPTILVDSRGTAGWAPVLLISWPPAPRFWPAAPLSTSSMHHLYAQVFPVAHSSPDNAFAAPETLRGICDEPSDVYSLGAILYLLCTRYAPTTSALRQAAEQRQSNALEQHEQGSGDHHLGSGPLHSTAGMVLIPPRLFNNRISARLEQILLCSLALNPAERYPSVFALLEELESIDPGADSSQALSARQRAYQSQASRISKMLERARRDLKD